MASISELQHTYHVFLSFRGTDIRNNFLGHLYRALDQRGIYTYIDSEELRKGEQISSALMKAIEQSRIAIIAFSQNYAASHWCLEELTKIMECKEQNDLIVLPVFYKVEPREVREQRQSYGCALAKQQCKFGQDSEKLKKWKKALFDAGSLSGWHLKDRDEAELIQDIIKYISIQLDRTPLHVAKHPVGINSRVEALKTMLSMESEDDVRMVGLWGPGGVGKSTMAKAIYNTLFRQFEGSSFLAHVRETSKKANGLVSLQAQLLSEILANKTLTVFSVDGGIKLIQERLCCKKVLIVLDDVDEWDQLNVLAGACDWFGKGSRIIITTRDRHLLTSHGIDYIHEVKLLNNEKAHELFGLHCFQGNQNTKISKNIIQNAVYYADGLPLALEVLGSFLHGRNELEWKNTLAKLANNPDHTINRVLKISFDALEHNEKEIFLDIACFFKGSEIEYVKKVLDSCGFFSTIGVKVLIERALICDEQGTMQMHDLIQLMGRDIIKQEYPDDPSRRSRLWFHDDVLDVLFGDMGTDAIKAIRLALPSPEEITISPNAFKNMRKLRLLIVLNTYVPFVSPICLPSELRWFEWPECSVSTLEFSSGPKKLVGLNIRKSPIRELDVNFKQFKNLKFIDLSECKSLVCTPDLSYTPNLEILDLSHCENLLEVHQSVGFLGKLEVLSLANCAKLTLFPDILMSKYLRRLTLSGCSRFERFPQIPEQMDYLKTLELERTAVKELPISIENIVSLERIHLSSCRNLITLPSSVYNLPKLEYLNLENCKKFIEFPKKMDDLADPHGNFGFRDLKWLSLKNCNLSEVEFLDTPSGFTALKNLSLSGNNINSIPSSIKKCKYLEDLQVENCEQLLEIPELPSTVSNLCARNCKLLRKIPNLSNQTCYSFSANFSACPELIREGLKVSHIFPLEEIHEIRALEILVGGDEMPRWLLQGQSRNFMSFQVPLELYDNIVGLVICATFLSTGGIMGGQIPVEINIDNYLVWNKELDIPLGSDHVWLMYLPRYLLREPIGLQQRLREKKGVFTFRISISNGFRPFLKKSGFHLILKQQVDDLKVVLLDGPEHTDEEKNQPAVDLVLDEEKNELAPDRFLSDLSGPHNSKFNWLRRLWKGCMPSCGRGERHLL